MTKKKHDPARCQYRDALNRQCRMFRLDTHPSLCYEHAKAEHIVRDAEYRRDKRASYSGSFYTTTDINQALGSVFTLLAQDRIPARDAAVLAYISQLLLQTINGVRYETELTLGFEGYRSLVRNIISPPRQDVPAAYVEDQESPGDAASPDNEAPQEAPVETGATHEPSCTMNPSNFKESS